MVTEEYLAAIANAATIEQLKAIGLEAYTRFQSGRYERFNWEAFALAKACRWCELRRG